LILALKGRGNVSSTIKRFSSSSSTTTRGGCWLACCIVKKRETFPYNLFPPKYQHQKKKNLNNIKNAIISVTIFEDSGLGIQVNNENYIYI
jgi:hypothetical protein